MKKKDITKKEIRRLAQLAYQRELDAELEKLFSQFGEWRKGATSCHELSDAIHDFHDGPSRKLWSYYAATKAPQQLRDAIAAGIVKEDEVAPIIREALQTELESRRASR